MQDSLEDYIQISKNTKDTVKSDPKISQEVLAIEERRKQCESYALKLVELFIDGKLQPQIFLRSLNFMTPEHYQDAVEERAISYMCGYAICGKRLPKMPVKQFHISTKLNKVYDITDRKHFCSNYCYQASAHIKAQIDSRPLSLRKPEDLVVFNLLPREGKITSPGVEIDHGLVKVNEEPVFTSIHSFAAVCLEEAEESEDNSIPTFENTEDEFKPKSILKGKNKNEVPIIKMSNSVDTIKVSENTPKANAKLEVAQKIKRNAERLGKMGINIAEITEKKKIDDDKINVASKYNKYEEIDLKMKEKLAQQLNIDDIIEKKSDPNSFPSNTKQIQSDAKQNELTSKRKVRFEDSLTASTSESSNSMDEISDLKTSIDQLCKSMNITLKASNTQTQTTIPEVEERLKPVKIEEAKMQRAIEKVYASDKNRQRNPILIDTKLNPEMAKNREKIMISVEAKPKYLQKIAEKIKKLEVDSNLKDVLQKVKNIEMMKQKKVEDARLNSVLEKIKNKDSKKKGPVLIETEMNPELVEIESKVTLQKVELKPEISLTALDSVMQKLMQWIMLDTYIFLHGEERVKNILNEKTLGDYFDKLKVTELEVSRQVRYMDICKRLQLKELAEAKFDNATLGREIKPLPDYNKLKNESKDMDIKVKAFLGGSMFEKENQNFPKDVMANQNQAVLPLVDVASQNALRKKIFINSVSKYVQNHINELGLDEYILNDVQNMIKTFKLQANNIVFKPKMWDIIAMILIIILTCKDENLDRKLKEDQSLAYRNKVFNTFSNTEISERIMNIVNDVETFIENYVTNNDVT